MGIYTWGNAITQVAPYLKSIPTASGDVVLCDQVNSYLWKAYPWRWTQATLTSASGVLSLVDGQQDYAMGTLSGSGYYQMLRIRLTRTDTTPWIAREKNWINWLPPCLDMKGGIDSIQALSFEPTAQKIRLDRAASVPSGTTYQIDGEYQFLPTAITLTSGATIWPDIYFNVIVEHLKWFGYALGDDSREPTQRAVALGMLNQMVSQEDYANATGTRFPDSGLGVTRAGNPGLFGWQG